MPHSTSRSAHSAAADLGMHSTAISGRITAVFTFLERSDLKGKTIKPFCTNEGSGMGESEKDIKVLCPDSTIEKGLSIWGSKAADSEKALKKWL